MYPPHFADLTISNMASELSSLASMPATPILCQAPVNVPCPTYDWNAADCTSWGITHKTSSPHYPQSNGFAEACMKYVKHALQCAKYSGADPQLALLAL